MNWFVDICRIHNLIILPGLGRRDAGARGRGAATGVIHVGEAPRYKQIDHTTSGLIALQADELHYKPKVTNIIHTNIHHQTITHDVLFYVYCCMMDYIVC